MTTVIVTEYEDLGRAGGGDAALSLYLFWQELPASDAGI